MKKLIVILSLVASLQIYAADGGRDPRDESDPFGRQFISHSVLSPEDRARFDQDFDEFLTGTDQIQSSLPEGPMSTLGGGMNSAAQAALASRVVQSGLPDGVYQIEYLPDGFSTVIEEFDFMYDSSHDEDDESALSQSYSTSSSEDENDGYRTPEDQIGMNSQRCPGTGVSERTPQPVDPRFADGRPLAQNIPDEQFGTPGSLTGRRERSESFNLDDIALPRDRNTRRRRNSDAGSEDDFTGNPV
ncbi:hypothetical protein EBQ93_00320 [bacterium]|nr:hypothetical protein [bacterium]